MKNGQKNYLPHDATEKAIAPELPVVMMTAYSTDALVKLNGITGLDVLREIRGNYPYLPVILITGYAGEMGSLVERGLELSAFAYLYKPLEMEKLFSLLEEIKREKLQRALGEK